MGSTKMCLSSTRHILDGQKASQREKKEREKAIQIQPTITSICTYNLGREDTSCAVRTEEGRDD
jgi:hypothetical protein